MTDLSSLFATTEQQYGLPPGILRATAQVESSNRPSAVSPQGALGIMQLMPDTAKGLSVNPYDVPQAIDGAGRLWQQNLQATGGDIDRAAMMYHGGPDTSKWGPKTQAYPGKLLAAMGPSPQAQGGGDPIEAALSGQAPPNAPQAQQAADPHDPVEAALTGQEMPNDAQVKVANAHMLAMIQSGASPDDVMKYGASQGVNPDPKALTAAMGRKGPIQFVHGSSQSEQQPPQLQTDQGLGFYQGIMKPFDNAATWLQEGASKIGLDKPINVIGSALGLPTNEQAIAGHQAYIQGQEAQGKTPGKLGEFGGEVAGTIPLAAVTKNPWIAGGASGALTTKDPNNLGQTAVDAFIGAGGGKIASELAGGISRVISPQVSKAIQTLHNLGVQMTPGQIMGGALRRIEDASTSIPFLGDLVKSAQQRSSVSLNTGIINDRVLGPIGKALPAGLTGRSAVDFADNAVSDAYNNLLPKLTVKADGQFVGNVGDILKTASELPPDRAAQVQNIINNSFLSRFDRPGLTMSGDTFKEADTKLGQLAREYTGSPDPEQRKMGGIFRDVQGELRATLARSNPAQAGELGNINQAFANLVRVEGASGSAAAKGGIFTPSQLGQAVKRFDTSARKKSYATGNALLQDVSDPAQQVLPTTLPDSGTPFRTVAAYLLGGGAAHISPFAAPLAIPPLLYNKLGQKAFQSAVLAPRGPGAKALAQALAKLKAPLAVAGGSAAAEASDGR